MKIDNCTSEVTIPNSDDFREWLIGALTRLEISAHKLSDEAHVGRNAVRKFITGEQNDLRLNSANAIVQILHETSRRKRVSLPPIPGSGGNA